MRLEGQEVAEPLNVVVIKTDDQRWDTLWAMPLVQDTLVRRGVTFRNAFVSTSLCSPERASFLAGGFYAHHTGVLTNESPNGGATQFVDTDTLPVRLQRAGYQTAMLGKYLNGYARMQPYIPPGWTTFIEATGGENWVDYSAIIGSSTPEASGVGAAVHVSQYLTDFLREQAVNFLGAADAAPFFLYLAPHAPHTPAIPAPSDAALFADYLYRERGYKEADVSDKPYLQDDIQRYDTARHDALHRRQLQALQAVDRAVGAVVQELERLGQLEKTLVVFTSDNGYMWGEHWQERKGQPYEESLRVPLVVGMPGIPPREDDHLIVVNLDVPTTLFAVAGMPRTDTDGQSLEPLLRNPESDWRAECLIESYQGLTKGFWAGLRTERYKYVEYAAGPHMFFDLLGDPYELENQIDNPAYQDIVQTLAARLESLKGVAIISPRPPPGTVGQSFAWPLAAWGGTPPYVWTIVEGSLPPGLTLESDDGLVAGTPTQAGPFPVQIRVTDASISPYSGGPQTYIRAFRFRINP
jgi:arylsulfatase A-like enzyme